MNKLISHAINSILFLIIAFLPVNAFSEKFYIDKVGYRTIDDQCAEVYYASEVDSIVIHSEVNGYTVTRICDRVFDDFRETHHVSMPNTITHIGRYAFADCISLQELVIPPSVRYIGDSAFFNLLCVKSVTIPKSVTYIGHALFLPYTVFTELKVEEGNPVYDSRENCNGIIESATNTIIASCYTTQIPNSVKHIGRASFLGSGKRNIEIPEGVETIKSLAFQGADIENISLPNSIIEIGDSAFFHSELKSVIIPKHIKHIGNSTFAYSPLGTVVFPDSLETIGISAFQSCCIADIKLPSTVKHIDDYAFWRSSQYSDFARITIPDSIKTIGKNIINENHIGVIYNAENCSITNTVFRPKKSILFGKNVKSIPNNLLNHNYNIPIIISKNTTPPQIDDNFFNDSIKSFATLYVPKGCIDTYRNATGWHKIKNIIENPGEFTSLTLNKSYFELPEGRCDSVVAYTTPHTNTNLIAWGCLGYASSNFIKIDQNGKVYSPIFRYYREDTYYKLMAYTLDGSDLEASCDFFKFSITVDSIYFDKSEMTIKQGETDTLRMITKPDYNTRLGMVAYTGIPEFTIRNISESDTTQNITFIITPNQPGDYTFSVYTKIDTISCHITVLKDSAVENICFDDKPASELSRYDIHGRKLPRPMRGINIIRMSDGTIRKEYVK